MTKRKMEDVMRKLEALYDRLRSGVVSGSIHNFIVPKTIIISYVSLVTSNRIILLCFGVFNTLILDL